MSVLVDSAGYADLLIRRGVTLKFGVRWEHSADGGGTFAPVDVTGDTAELVLASTHGEEWYRVAASPVAGGLVQVTVPAAVTAGEAWRKRNRGIWWLNLTRQGEVVRLAEGAFVLDN